MHFLTIPFLRHVPASLTQCLAYFLLATPSCRSDWEIFNWSYWLLPLHCASAGKEEGKEGCWVDSQQSLLSWIVFSSRAGTVSLHHCQAWAPYHTLSRQSRSISWAKCSNDVKIKKYNISHVKNQGLFVFKLQLFYFVNKVLSGAEYEAIEVECLEQSQAMCIQTWPGRTFQIRREEPRGVSLEFTASSQSPVWKQLYSWSYQHRTLWIQQ